MKIQRLKWTAAILLFLAFPAGAEPTMSLAGVDQVEQSSAATLELRLTGGTEPYGGFNAKIALPKGVNVTGVSPGELISAGFVIDYQVTEDAGTVWLALLAYASAATITGADGVLLNIALQVTDAAAVGTYPIAFAETNADPAVNAKHALSDAYGSQSLPHGVTGAQMSITSPSPDTDGDGIPDATDNCPNLANADQENFDNDSQGDACDPDDDNDGLTDVQESALGTDPRDQDSDDDGVHDLIDSFPMDRDIQPPTGVLDATGNGLADSLTDGLLIIRHLFGFSGETLTAGALESEAKRTGPETISGYLEGNVSWLDVDDNGRADALTDGLLIMRYLFGFRGDVLIRDAVANDANRTSASAVENYIKTLLP